MTNTASFLIMIYITIINIAAFCLYGIDKYKAKNNKWRIPESTLLALAAAGGSFGAFASMYLFRHKTRKWKFSAGIPLLMAVHAALAYYLLKAVW